MSSKRMMEKKSEPLDRMISIRVRRKTLEAFNAISEEANVSRNKVINRLLELHIEKREQRRRESLKRVRARKKAGRK